MRTIIIGPDPIPVRDPRPGFQATQEGTTTAPNILELVDGDIIPPTSVQPGYGLYDNGGVLALTPSAGASWPAADPGIPGAMWSNGLEVTASLPFTASADPQIILWGDTNAVQLQGLNATLLPVTDPHVLDAVWVNVAMGGPVWISTG